MAKVTFLNSQARLYHKALEAVNKDVVQVFARGYDGVFMTLEAYEALKSLLSPFELQTHQSLLWDTSMAALETDTIMTKDQVLEQVWAQIRLKR